MWNFIKKVVKSEVFQLVVLAVVGYVAVCVLEPITCAKLVSKYGTGWSIIGL